LPAAVWHYLQAPDSVGPLAVVVLSPRSTHEYLGLNAADEFQEVIFAKTNAAGVVRRELGRRSWKGDWVAIGTATDPYQQAEARYWITRDILKAFPDYRNPLTITRL
jgi:DNA repair photolyase